MATVVTKLSTDVAAEEHQSDGDEITERFVVAFGVKVLSDGTVTGTKDSNLGMLYIAVLQCLLNRKDLRTKWIFRKTLGLRWNLLLSEAQGQNIPWKKIGALVPNRGDAPPLVNFSRGFKILCRKSMLVTTLRQHALMFPPAKVEEWFPKSFVFYPAKPDKSEREDFLTSVGERRDNNTWILKPSDGGKGERIKVMHADNENRAQEIIEFLESQPEGSISWVVSEYLERPLLLPGERKFDWRLWVYLDTLTYEIRLWKEGVFRTCSVPFNLDNLDDDFSHLSNHCIQVTSEKYGSYEATNEMFYPEFECIVGKELFRQSLLPQARHIICETLMAARETLLCDAELTGVAPFNVFGFDLMVDANMVVKLIEVNSSPAAAEELVGALVEDLVEVLSPSWPSPTNPNGWEAIERNSFS